MLRLQYSKGQRAQIFLEYVIVIGVVVLIMIAMSTMIKRGTQGMIKVVADQIGEQANAEQRFDDTGFLESSYTSTRAITSKTKEELSGVTTYIFGDTTTIKSNVHIDMGFTEEN